MARRPDLPRSLRRSAGRPALAGREPSERLTAAVQSGLLSRANTEKGTRGRQAVDRYTYIQRQMARPHLSAREAAGHERPEVRAGRAISALLDRPQPFTVLEAPTRLEASRAGRYDSLTAQLAAGVISPTLFRRKVASWQPIRGERFLADPDRVLATMEARRAGDEELFVYRSGRAA